MIMLSLVTLFASTLSFANGIADVSTISYKLPADVAAVTDSKRSDNKYSTFYLQKQEVTFSSPWFGNYCTFDIRSDLNSVFLPKDSIITLKLAKFVNHDAIEFKSVTYTATVVAPAPTFDSSKYTYNQDTATNSDGVHTRTVQTYANAFASGTVTCSTNKQLLVNPDRVTVASIKEHFGLK